MAAYDAGAGTCGCRLLAWSQFFLEVARPGFLQDVRFSFDLDVWRQQVAIYRADLDALDQGTP